MDQVLLLSYCCMFLCIVAFDKQLGNHSNISKDSRILLHGESMFFEPVNPYAAGGKFGNTK